MKVRHALIHVIGGGHDGINAIAKNQLAIIKSELKNRCARHVKTILAKTHSYGTHALSSTRGDVDWIDRSNALDMYHRSRPTTLLGLRQTCNNDDNDDDNDVHAMTTHNDPNNPLLSWVDFNLIPDNTCMYAIDEYAHERSRLAAFDAIVMDRDHARMWNIAATTSRLSYGNIGRTLLQNEHPFWVDRNGLARVTSRIDERIEVIKDDENYYDEEDNDDSCRTTIRNNAFNEDRINVLLDEFVDDALTRRPTLRLLMIDQYERFLAHDERKYPNLVYAFSCAPSTDRLSGEREIEFYQRLNEHQTSLDATTIPITNTSTTTTTTTNVDASSTVSRNVSRECHFAWRTFVPSIDQVPKRYTNVRSLNVQLFDDSSTRAFWLNLIRECFKNERNAITTTVTARNDDNNDTVALLIHVCTAIPKGYRATNDRRLATLRRFKRFMAYIVRLYRVIGEKKLTHAPGVYWTVVQPLEIVYFLHNAIVREYILGARERLVNFDRYAKPPIVNPVRSYCPIIPTGRTSKTKNYRDHNNDNNNNDDDYDDVNDVVDSTNAITGIFYGTLINEREFFANAVYRLDESVVYAKRSRCAAPVQKLYNYEY